MLQRRHSALSSHQDSNSTTSASTAAAAANATVAGDAYRHDDNCNNVSILSNTSSDEDEDDLGTMTGQHRHRQLAFAASDTDDDDDDDDAFELRLSNYHKKASSYPATTFTTTTRPIFSYSDRFSAEKENNQCSKTVIDAEDNSDVDVDDYSDDSSSTDRTKLLLLNDSKLNEPSGEVDDGSHRKENGPTDKPTGVKQEPQSPSRDPDKSFDPMRHLLTSEASRPFQTRLVNDATAFFRQLERHQFSFPSTFPFYPFFPPPSLLFSAQSHRPFSQLPTGVATSPPPHVPSTPGLPGQGKESVVPDLPASSSVQHFNATARQMMFYHQQQQRHLFQQHRHNILNYQSDKLGIPSDGMDSALAAKSSSDSPRFLEDKFNNAELKSRDNFFKSHRYSQLFHQALRTKDQTFDDTKSGILKKSSLSFLSPGKTESEAEMESGFSAQLTDKGRTNGSEGKATEETLKNHESSLVTHTSMPYFRTNSSLSNSRSHRNVSPPTSNRASKSSTPPRKTSSILQA